MACATIGALMGKLYAIERLVPGVFPVMPSRKPCASNYVASKSPFSDA
jgi:hypothetical protein